MAIMVDFIPKYNSVNQFFKIKDTDLFQMNNRVSTLLNLLSYEEGTNSIFPFMGAYKKLQSINYSENMSEIMDGVKSTLQEYLDFEVNLTHEQDERDESKYIINIEVQDLPGKLAFELKKTGTFVKLINPRYINN